MSPLSATISPKLLPNYKGKTSKLNTGSVIPALGLGTFQDPDEQEMSVYTALQAGYRHIDTAHNYGTEQQVGRGIRRSGVSREDIFITTKLWCNAHHPDDVAPALDASLADLGVDYIDLYLMHYPCAFKRGADFLPVGPDKKMISGDTPFIETWRAMEKLLATGRTKAIGVSNFSQHELDVILKEGSVIPAAHQMELHPYLQQPDFVKWYLSKGIHIIQFSPCGNLNNFYREVSWGKEIAQINRLVDHPTLAEVAAKYRKTPIQVALAWAVTQGRSVIPKSTIKWQIEENLQADFELEGEDLLKIATMDRKARFNDPSSNFGYNLYFGLDGAAS